MQLASVPKLLTCSGAASFPTLHGPVSDPLPPFGANVALENRCSSESISSIA